MTLFLPFLFAAAAAVPCPPESVCAANPASVVTALWREGFQAKTVADGEGDPMIESAASGYHCPIDFYGCEAHAKCKSLRFHAGFAGDRSDALDAVNQGNATHRFAALSLDSDDELVLSYDVTTIGGLPPANFVEILDWWSTGLGELSAFLEAHPASAEPPVPATAVQRSVSRGISSTKLQGRWRISSWLARMPSHASFTAPVEPGSAKI